MTRQTEARNWKTFCASWRTTATVRYSSNYATKDMKLSPAILLLASLSAFSLYPSLARSQTPSISASVNPVEMVRKAVQNEVKGDSSPTNGPNGPKFMFREDKQDAGRSQTKLLVETREAMVGLLIAENGRPLTPEQRQTEDARLKELVDHPDELKKKERREKEDADRTERIMRAFPDAFLYEADGSVHGEEGLGAPGDKLIRLKFRPNPNYSPPTHVEQILTGLQGYMLIDSKEYRIAKIDGNLVKEVGFGWGILGHLDRGGHFLVQQGDMGQGDWEITRMELFFTGKALFFKNIYIKSQEAYTDFQPAPRDLTFAQGVELLKKQQALLAQNQQAGNETRKQ